MVSQHVSLHGMPFVLFCALDTSRVLTSNPYRAVNTHMHERKKKQRERQNVQTLTRGWSRVRIDYAVTRMLPAWQHLTASGDKSARTPRKRHARTHTWHASERALLSFASAARLRTAVARTTNATRPGRMRKRAYDWWVVLYEEQRS